MSGSNSWLVEAITWGVYPPATGGGGGTVTELQVQRSAFNYAPATGVDDAFVVVLNPAVASLSNNLIVSMSSGTLQNLTSSPTLQVNALSPVLITLWGGLSLAPNDISPNTAYLLIYDLTGNTFQLINPSVSNANTFLVQENFYNSAIDVGTSNAFSITLVPAPQSSYGEGFPVYMRAGGGHTNTGASTLTVNGTTDPIVLQNGSALPANTILANGSYWFLWSTNLSSWVLQNPMSLLLTPSGNQTITTGSLTLQTGSMFATVGSYNSGSAAGGFSGSFKAFSTTANLGSLAVTAGNNAGNFANVLTNASTAAARTWTLPDATGTIALTSTASGIINSGTANQLAYYAASGTTLSGVGPGSAGQLFQSAGASSPPAYTTATYPSTAGTSGNVLTSNGTNWVSSTPPSGGLAIASIAGTTQTAAVNTKYYALAAGQTLVSLPATYAVSDVIAVIGSTANTGGWVILASTGDTIRYLNSTTSAGGTLTSSASAGSTVYLECDVANTSWVVSSTVNVTLTTA